MDKLSKDLWNRLDHDFKRIIESFIKSTEFCKITKALHRTPDVVYDLAKEEIDRNIGNYMKYREFTDALLIKVGDINWGMVGRMSKIFKTDFILDTADLLPDHIMKKSTTEKARFLLALCKKHASDNDFVVDEVQKAKIDWSNF